MTLEEMEKLEKSLLLDGAIRMGERGDKFVVDKFFHKLPKEYMVSTEWSGYSRGKTHYKVFAETEEEAREFFYEGEITNKYTVRDDTESEVTSVTLIEEVNT